MKRRKYHDESTKVSMVSVSRVAGPPQIGQVVLRNSGLVASGDCPVGRNSTSSGASTGSWSVGHGDDAVVGAVDDGDGASPEALARDQPVAEAVVDRARADALGLQPLDGPGLGGGDVQPVEPLAVDLLAVPGVGPAGPAVWSTVLVPALGGLHGAHDRAARRPGRSPSRGRPRQARP